MHFELPPQKEMAAELASDLGKQLRQRRKEVLPDSIAATDKRLTGFANLRLSDLADLAQDLKCRVEIKLISEAD